MELNVLLKIPCRLVKYIRPLAPLMQRKCALGYTWTSH